MTPMENDQVGNDLRCNEFAKVNCERLDGVEKV